MSEALRHYRFLADENFPGPSITRLRNAGYDVRAIGKDSAGLGDDGVLLRAIREHRFLLTFDRDHGELIFLAGHPAPPGVIYFRLESDDTEEPAYRVLELIAERTRQLDGQFTVVTPRRTRQRPLP